MQTQEKQIHTTLTHLFADNVAHGLLSCRCKLGVVCNDDLVGTVHNAVTEKPARVQGLRLDGLASVGLVLPHRFVTDALRSSVSWGKNAWQSAKKERTVDNSTPVTPTHLSPIQSERLLRVCALETLGKGRQQLEQDRRHDLHRGVSAWQRFQVKKKLRQEE